MAAQEQNGNTDQVNPEAAFSQALKDLARGEKTATALENHLSALEKKIDELLASAEQNNSMASEKAESSNDATAVAVESSKEKSDPDASNTTA